MLVLASVLLIVYFSLAVLPVHNIGYR